MDWGNVLSRFDCKRMFASLSYFKWIWEKFFKVVLDGTIGQLNGKPVPLEDNCVILPRLWKSQTDNKKEQQERNVWRLFLW